MKIVQSFWSKPCLQSELLMNDSRLDGGWPHRSLNYYSWALSCLQLRRFYEEVELVTDRAGKEILIDFLQLPYTSVRIELNALDHYDAGLWSIGKVYTHGLQDKPFLHVDSDVVLLKPFPERIAQAGIVTQSLEIGYPLFTGGHKTIWDCFVSRPVYFSEIYANQHTDCCNAGIIGGTDIAFLHRYVEEVFSFLALNEQPLLETAVPIDAGCVAVMLEQVILYAFAQHCGKPIDYLLHREEHALGEVGLFQAAPRNQHYVHCYGYFKSLRTTYAYLEWMLQAQYPDYYRRINQHIMAAEI